jgi:hypothetical protein
VAVAVIRGHMRPPMPDSDDGSPQDFRELINNAWHPDPTIRPSFLVPALPPIYIYLYTVNIIFIFIYKNSSISNGQEVMTRLSGMGDNWQMGSMNSFTDRGRFGPVKGSTSSSNLAGSTTSSSSSAGACDRRSTPSPRVFFADNNAILRAGGTKAETELVGAPVAGGARAPEGEVTIVFSDITRAASLWEFNADAMRDATLLHNALMRELLHKHRGYEVVFLRYASGTSVFRFHLVLVLC